MQIYDIVDRTYKRKLNIPKWESRKDYANNIILLGRINKELKRVHGDPVTERITISRLEHEASKICARLSISLEIKQDSQAPLHIGLTESTIGEDNDLIGSLPSILCYT